MSRRTHNGMSMDDNDKTRGASGFWCGNAFLSNKDRDEKEENHDGSDETGIGDGLHQMSQNLSSVNYERHDEEEDNGLVFSCRCESTKAVAMLLSCLRSSSSSSSSGVGSIGESSLTQRGRGGVSSGAAAGSSLNLSVSDMAGTANVTGATNSGRRYHQHATVFASKDSLTFHVHGLANQSQTSVDIRAGLFSDYSVGKQVIPILEENDENQRLGETERTIAVEGGEFGINLTRVLECLHILGTAALDRTKLAMSYSRQDALFHIQLYDKFDSANSLLASASMSGFAVQDDDDDDDDADFRGQTSDYQGTSRGPARSGLAVAFQSSPVVARAIVKSDALRDAVVELHDVPGATCATIAMSSLGLDFATSGHTSECHVSLPRATPNGDDDVFVSLDCAESDARQKTKWFGRRSRKKPANVHARSYPLHAVLSAMRGLEIALETCISINSAGMIAVQHQVVDNLVGNGEPNFVDFIMTCLDDDILASDDEDEDSQSEATSASDSDAENASVGQQRNRIQRRNARPRAKVSHGRPSRPGRRTALSPSLRDASSIRSRTPTFDDEETRPRKNERGRRHRQKERRRRPRSRQTINKAEEKETEEDRSEGEGETGDENFSGRSAIPHKSHRSRPSANRDAPLHENKDDDGDDEAKAGYIDDDNDGFEAREADVDGDDDDDETATGVSTALLPNPDFGGTTPVELMNTEHNSSEQPWRRRRRREKPERRSEHHGSPDAEEGRGRKRRAPTPNANDGANKDATSPVEILSQPSRPTSRRRRRQRRRTTRKDHIGGSDTPSSPELMYGDTCLQNSDTE